MTDPTTDPLMRRLAGLPRAAPDECRTAAVRERCHAAFARGRGHADTAHRARAGVVRLLELGAVAAIGLLYASAIVSQAMSMYAAR
jgi:hypothetical protein